MKVVEIVGHEFDCLPGHVMIDGRGVGSSLRTAVCDAIRNMFSDRRLHHKRISEFKLSVIVLSDRKGES